MKKDAKLSRVSFTYKKVPATTVPTIMAWIIKCMTNHEAFLNPPIPLVPPVPADPTKPMDMTTRMNLLSAANAGVVDGGMAQTGARDAALVVAFDGLDANGLYVQTVCRTNLALLLASGYQAVNTNRGQLPLDAPSITGIDNDVSTQLDVHLSPVTNSIGFEVQILIAGVWTTVKFSSQARTITLIGLTTGTVVQVRARALGGSTGESAWSTPSSSIVD